MKRFIFAALLLIAAPVLAQNEPVHTDGHIIGRKPPVGTNSVTIVNRDEIEHQQEEFLAQLTLSMPEMMVIWKEKAFAAKFECPEFQNPPAAARAMADFRAFMKAWHSKMSEADVNNYRVRLLAEKHCVATLAAMGRRSGAVP